MAERDIRQNLEGEENAPLPEEQLAVPDILANISQMGNNPIRARQQHLQDYRGRNILRARRLLPGPKFLAPNVIGENERESLSRHDEFCRSLKRGKNVRVGQQHGRDMQFLNNPRMDFRQCNDPAQPQEINVPEMTLGESGETALKKFL
ncbi:hypothetical protein HNY73_005252 [Argiope bruennichi]|uniref:Uncharacterized protein n=1 Tax=Argiope bruennichi TaxID=94029 RepID=A0A8T0FGS5_ARGBR|nr:hypothetical protein HNY73_005252 [Argiope bruennichi]